MPSIELRNLGKSFRMRDSSWLHVLDDLTLDVRDGEFVCLLGPSGCGKSTTLDILADLTEADSGEVLVDGTPGTDDMTFGYVFQQPRLLNWRTVRQNLEFALKAHGVPRGQQAERIERHLALVGLDDFADAFPLTLSGGMRQRVALIRALVIEPDFLLMDEPFSSLDELTARRLRAELLALWDRSKKTVIFVTHNALEAAFLADRIYLVSRRPATLVESVAVDVPRPRRPDDPRLLEIQQHVIAILERSGIAAGDDAATEGLAPSIPSVPATAVDPGER